MDAGRMMADLKILQAQLASLALRKQSILREQEWRLRLLKEGLGSKDDLYSIDTRLQDIAGREHELQVTIATSRQHLGESRIFSPVEGHIMKLYTPHLGRVLGPGGVVAEIVPVDAKMEAEVDVDASVIGHVHVGQEVMMKLSSFDFSRYGGVKGRVSRISPNSTSDERGRVVYKVVVSINKRFVGKERSENQILTGMTLIADIKTGKKTVLEYLLKPIFYSASSALRER